MALTRIHTYRRSAFALILFLLAGPSLPLNAQTERVASDSLLRLGDVEFSRGSLDTSLDYYEEVLRSQPASIPALLGAGKCSVGLQDWGGAKDYFASILAIDTANIGAHYYDAICERETGKTKAWLLRKADWRASANHFSWVLAHDSLFLDAVYQHALLLNYEEKYGEAIEGGIAQVALTPRNDATRLGLFKLYKSFIVNDNAAALEWLRVRTDTAARYFLGEALRFGNKVEEAERNFRALLRPPAKGVIIPTYLSLARIAAKQNLTDAVEEDFWTAAGEIRNSYDADLIFEDLKYLVSDPELTLYKSLATSDEKTQFIFAFWNARNPSPGAGINPRIAEHYRRLVRAEEEYLYYGFRTQFTNPDNLKQLRLPRSFQLNQEFNDMGLIYVRHGAPDSKLHADSENEEPNESWLYQGGEDKPKMVFHFIKKNSVGNNWRLAPIPSNMEMISDLAAWNPDYLGLLKNNPTSQAKLLDQEVESVAAGLSTETHTWKKGTTPFEVPYAVNTFRGKGDKALVDISYAIPLSVITSRLTEHQQDLHIVVGLALHSLTKETEFSALDTIAFLASRAMTGSYVSLYRFYIPADNYTIAMQVRPLGTQLVGHWNTTMKIRDYSHSGFALSDLELLIPSQEKSAIEIQGIKVLPSPFRIINQDQQVYLYQRIYDLVKDGDGNTRYAARYILLPLNPGEKEPTSVEELDARDDAIVVASVARDGREENSAEFQKIDLSEVNTGAYKLCAIVTDRKRVQTIFQLRMIQVMPP